MTDHDETKTFVADPFGLKNLEISEAQNSEEALDEAMNDPAADTSLDEIVLEEAVHEESTALAKDFDIQLDNSALDQLAGAIAAETEDMAAKAAEELASWQPDADAAAKLAEQIAEDEALAKAQADEQEEVQAMDPELAAALPQVSENGELDVKEMQSCLEALLFMMDRPASMNRLREMIGQDFPLPVFQEAMSALMDQYKSAAHGIEVVEVAGGYQFRTKAGRAALAKKLAKVQTQRLSTGAMETLAIVAYRQPVMKEDIDKIRGVDSSYFVRGLLDKKLIAISGRSELPGRPMVYSTTDEFLQLFSLKDLSAMPSLRELEQMVPTSQAGNPEDEDPRVKEMRRLVGQMKSDSSTTLVYDPREDEKILKEIREKVQAIPSSTPYLDEQKELEKQAAAAAAAPAVPHHVPEASGSQGELGVSENGI
jgi:segregation and condensation protein B